MDELRKLSSSVREWVLDQKVLQRILYYNPETGIFTWLIDRPRIKVGDRAGHLHVQGYRVLSIMGFQYQEHRLAILYMTGTWPVDQVDHINRDRADNRWINLREATQLQNLKNKVNYKNNTTGFKGVTRHKGKYYAQIQMDGLKRSLGYFNTPEEASQAYKEATNKYFGEFSPNKTDLH